MAEIYNTENGEIITGGLQGRVVCDEAIQMAESIAKERGEPVLLVDDDLEWIVHPDGSIFDHEPEPEVGYEPPSAPEEWFRNRNDF